MKLIEAYQCDSCYMTSIHKSSVSRHEAHSCRKNPDRKTCLQCEYWFDDGVDDNGMDEPYKETWLMAGCEREHKPDYEARNTNTECPYFRKKAKS